MNLSDAEVKKEFEKIKATQFPKAAEFEKFLASLRSDGVGPAAAREAEPALTENPEADHQEEEHRHRRRRSTKYYNENKSKYGTPEKRNVRIILTKTEAQAIAAKKEIESGKSFASVASKDSIDPTSKADGGLLKEVVPGEEEKALDSAIFSATKGPIGGPVKTPFGYYIYQVVSITAGTQEPLSKVQATIKQQLISTGQQAALSKFVKEFKKKWMNQTECRSGYVVAGLQDLQSAEDTSGTAPNRSNSAARSHERGRSNPRPPDPRQSRQSHS